MAQFLGIDVGTSGCRAVLIDDRENIVAEAGMEIPEPQHHGVEVSQEPACWWQACAATLDALRQQTSLNAVAALTVDATSASVLLVDAHGKPQTPALMYNDARAVREAGLVSEIVPADAACHGAQSSLAKALWLSHHCHQQPCHLLHQADWLLGQFTGHWSISDSNNVLKLGYDVMNDCWPDWISNLLHDIKLPEVCHPGTFISRVSPAMQQRFGFSADTSVMTGTTDSTAAFLASGASEVGEAMTSLGSSLVIKVISDRPVFAPRYGVYSHRINNQWLVGGASNSGGAVLKTFFSVDEITALSAQIDPYHNTAYDYYPLNHKGERFPVCDPQLMPRITPRPESDVEFLQALLEGIAHIEQRGYQLLSELGAPYPISVRTVGKGASNKNWHIMRERILNTTLIEARNQDAAFGSALLAKRGYNDTQNLTTA